jgi:hypothetical protein
MLFFFAGVFGCVGIIAACGVVFGHSNHGTRFTGSIVVAASMMLALVALHTGVWYADAARVKSPVAAKGKP